MITEPFPEQVMKKRFRSHHMRKSKFGNPQIDVYVQGAHGKIAIRGRE